MKKSVRTKKNAIICVAPNESSIILPRKSLLNHIIRMVAMLKIIRKLIQKIIRTAVVHTF